MKDINEVREELSKVFADLRSGEIKASTASELNNCAGKIINSLKVELEYFALKKETPEIPFFNAAQKSK